MVVAAAGAAHGYHMLFEFTPVVQREFDDARPLLHAFLQLIVAHQVDAAAHRQHFALAHALDVVR